jgi:2-methylisocitrate lyase-like PEP mutase family enzyme
MTKQSEKGLVFQTLHQRNGAFVIPNPWDVGSARLLQSLGFEALATTSAGFANAFGKLDGQMTLAEKLNHCRALAAAVDIPINADFENGFAHDPAAVATNIARLADTGVVGASIEDYSGDDQRPIYDFKHAVERIQAAAEAVHGLDFPFLLTARAENLLHGVPDLDDTIARLAAYAAAGADVLYAPGLTTLDQVRRVTGAVNRPVNVLAPMVRNATIADLAAAGAKRLSVGGALARAAVGALLRAAKELRNAGTFTWTHDLPPSREVTDLLRPAAST